MLQLLPPEIIFAITFPVSIIFSYLYLASLRLILEGERFSLRITVFSLTILLLIALLPGPLSFLGALLVSLIIVFVTWRGKGQFTWNFKEAWREGCVTTLGCILRYLTAWPALAAVSTSIYPLLAPLIAMASAHVSLLNKPSWFRKLYVLIAWLMAFMNLVKNLLEPRWYEIQMEIVKGKEVKGMLALELLTKFFGKVGVYLYASLILLITAYTAIQIYMMLRRNITGAYAITLAAPIIGYAVATNKLGEPLTSFAYAFGATLIAFGLDLTKTSFIVRKLEPFLEMLGEAVLNYKLPLRPLIAMRKVLGFGGARKGI